MEADVGVIDEDVGVIDEEVGVTDEDVGVSVGPGVAVMTGAQLVRIVPMSSRAVIFFTLSNPKVVRQYGLRHTRNGEFYPRKMYAG